MDTDTRELLRGSLRHVLTDTGGRSLSARLDELGWDDVVADDEADALGLLFTVKGDTCSSADALGPVLDRRLATATGDPTYAGAAVALPGVSTISDDGGSVRVAAIFASTPDPAASFAVVSGDRVVVVPPTASLATKVLHGVDPNLGLVGVTGSVPVNSLQWIDGEAANKLIATAQSMLATELIGIAVHVIASAVTYTGQRVQYGKAIGTFQALQHRIATAHAQVTSATHLADEARRTGDPWTAMVAKAMAGQAAENACVQAQQCYGAIGFTWEHEFHRYLKRAYALDWIAGDWRSLERRIGATLQATGTVPYIGAL
jgi:hypothetical protein